MDPELDAFVVHVAGALHTVGVPYVIVGSYASSTLGRARATQDVDLIVRLRTAQVRDGGHVARGGGPRQGDCIPIQINAPSAHQTSPRASAASPVPGF